MYDSITNLGIAFGDGNENPSGVAELAYLIPLSWLKTEGKPAANATTAEALLDISANHVMNTGKAPIRVIPMYEKSGITWALEGEVLSKIFNQGAELFIPDNGLKSLGTLQAIKNYRFIVLIGKVDGSGHFWQIGNSFISAKIANVAGGTGQGPTGEVGSRITVQSYGVAPVFSYEGDVPPVGPAAP